MFRYTVSSLFLIVLLCAVVQPSSCKAEESPWSGQTVVITGANRGLGLEMARQLHSAGAHVIGTARNPGKAKELEAIGVQVEQLDVTDATSVSDLAKRLAGEKIDALFNNAGIFPQRGSFSEIDPEIALQVFNVNIVGPMRVTQALLPALHRGGGKLVMNMSSGLGSIANNSRGSSTDYRASKAALNMVSRNLAMELKDDGFIVVAMSPGWVRTDMGGERAPLSPAESVAGILNTLTSLGEDDSGSYFSHDGQTIPW